MNLQAPMAGQYPRQVTNQAVSSMSAMPQQQNMMQNSEISQAPIIMESARRFMQDKIYKYIMQ